MRLDRVTVTGADDSIGHPENLVPLTQDFPFVEWGILVSANNAGSPRFPSLRWLEDMKQLAQSKPLPLSMHLCGRWVREMLLGIVSVPPFLIEGPWFQRIQLNFHAENTPCEPKQCFTALLSLGPRQYIFQIDGANGNEHLEAIFLEQVEHDSDDDPLLDAVPLFDISGGAGLVPSEWPKPNYLDADYYGYAGGLGPDTLEQQLPLIAAAAGDTRIWIDMETRVRSADDRQFDLDKVRRSLEICAPFVTQVVSLASSASALTQRTD